MELVAGGKELGRRENPYFNRDVFTFCSHRHTPNSGEYGGPGMVESEAGIYIAWRVFEDYATIASLALKETVLYAINRLLSFKTLRTTLPVQGVTTLQKQPSEQRYVNHLLYTSPVKRGKGIEIIEDILPVYDVSVELRIKEQVKQAYLAPQMTLLPFTQTNGVVQFTLPKLETHQMIVLDYAN